MAGRPLTPEPMITMVTIDAVDVAKRMAHCMRGNQYGGQFWAHFRYTPDSFQMPNTKERWMVQRVGFQWRLLHRIESPDEEDYRATIAPGDNHVRATGTVHIHATAIDIVPKGRETDALPLGATRWQVRTTGGATTTWALSHTPVSLQSVMLFNDGSLIDPSTLTLNGNTLGFGSIGAGHRLVVYYQSM